MFNRQRRRRRSQYSPTARVEQRNRGSCSCTGLSLLLLSMLVLCGLAYPFWLRPLLSSYIGQQVGDGFGSSGMLPGLPAPPAESPDDNRVVLPEVVEGGGEAVPPPAAPETPAVPALPTLPDAPAEPIRGEFVVTEAEANAFLAQQQAAFAPAEQVRVRFLAGEMQTTVVVYGTETRLRAGLAVENELPVLTNPRLEGVGGVLFSAEELVAPLEQQMQQLLVQQGQAVRAVRVEAGQIVVSLEPA